MEIKKWLYYTVFVGALPILIRLFICLLLRNASWTDALNPMDFIFWSLTLSLSNINQLNNLKANPKVNSSFKEDRSWWNVVIIIFIVSDIAACNIKDLTGDQLIDTSAVWIVTIIMSVISFCYSLYITYKLKIKEA